MTFNRYYVSYSLCCPSRVTLLTGRYAHNHNVRGNVPPEGGYTGFSIRNAYNHNIATWLPGAGYRTIHIGKFLNGYGDEPFDDGSDRAPGWDAWHTVLKSRHQPLLLRLHAQQQRGDLPPYGESGSWETREYGDPRRHRLPAGADQRAALQLRDRRLQLDGRAGAAGHPTPRRSTCRSTTPPRTATSAVPPGPSRHPDTTTGSRGRRLPTTAPKDSTRATSPTSRASSAKRCR